MVARVDTLTQDSRDSLYCQTMLNQGFQALIGELRAPVQAAGVGGSWSSFAAHPIVGMATRERSSLPSNSAARIPIVNPV